jgi:hypothetical protein
MLFTVPLPPSSCSARDGILGHQFDKGLESFAPRFLQSLLLGKPYSTMILKIHTKNQRSKKTQVYSLMAFSRTKKPNKNPSLRILELMPRNLD